MLALKEETKNKAAARAAEKKKQAERRAEEEKKAAERRAEEERKAAKQALRKLREEVASKVRSRGVPALSTQDIVVILEQEQVSCVGNIGQPVVVDARVGCG